MTDDIPETTTKIDGLHPIFARYDVAAAGLHRRSAHGDDPAVNALLATAAHVIDMPLCLFSQDDVPSELSSPLGSLLTLATPDAMPDAEIYLLDVPDKDDGHTIDAALNLAKGGRFSVDRKEVVYYTDRGVARALEPRGIKEALNSLQKDQWMLAIEKEMDNLRAHDAFHYVPVKEALTQGKKIMRMTWVFKIKTLDSGALASSSQGRGLLRELCLWRTRHQRQNGRHHDGR
jgi:hypothetical protein